MARAALVLLSSVWLSGCLFGQSAVSSHDLAAFFAALPHDSAIGAMYFCPFSGSSTLARLAMLTESKKFGRQIVVYVSWPSGHFDKERESGVLPAEFAVSQASSFRLVNIGDDEFVEFSGCKAHECNHSVGVLLYSPQLGRKFQALSRGGRLEYSREVESSQAVKQYLASRIETLTSFR